MQRSDSPARSVPGYWLGDPSAGFRIPFDWTFAAWRAWAVLCVLLLVPMLFAVPAGLLLLVAAWRLGERAQPHVMQIRLPSGRNVTAQAVMGLVLVLALAIAPSPAWLLPLFWPLAILATPLVAGYLTRKLRPFFDDINTPVSYWWRLLPRIASGPRARREPGMYVPAMETEIIPSIEALTDIEYLALTLDSRKVIVKTAKPKTPTVEFDQWLPTHHDKAANTLAWLASHRAGTEVAQGTNVLLVKRPGRIVRVNPGDVVLRQPTGDFAAMREHLFRAEYDVVSE